MLYSFDSHTIEPSPSAQREAQGDAQLLRDAAEADPKALQALRQRHTLALRNVVVRVLGSAPETEAVLEAIFRDLPTHARHFATGNNHAMGFLTTIARRYAINRLRENTVAPEARALTPAPAAPAAAASEEAEKSRLESALGAAIEGLPREQREVLGLSYYYGMRPGEIAVQTGLPLDRIKIRLEQGIDEMTSALRSRFGLSTFRVA